MLEALVVGVALIVVAVLVTRAWVTVATLRNKAAHAVAAAIQTAAADLSMAWRHRWDLEFELSPSPRMTRERERDVEPQPLSKDARMAPFEAWARSQNPPLDGKRLEHLRVCYALLAGVKRTDDVGRLRRAEEAMVAYGVEVPQAPEA